MKNTISYKRTLLACYMGNIIQAITVNLTPLLFIPLKTQFGFSYEELGRLVLINFVTQVIVDISFSKLVDKYGPRRFVVSAQILGTVGLVLFAFAANAPVPYAGFVIATVVFSVSAGLHELLLSPIVNAIPSDEKAAAMSLLHSFYSWGHMGVVIITTLLLFWGGENWRLVVLMWALFPAINTFLFIKSPLAPMIPEEDVIKIRSLFNEKFFIVVLFAMFFGAVSELCMAQWASAFLEKLGLDREIGNIAGLSLFAFMMALGRTIHGKTGGKADIFKILSICGAGGFVCYIIVALSPIPIISLIACALSGLFVSLLWPGTVSISASRFPLAGASMFALLAFGGDSGASLGPWLVGFIADRLGLRVGLAIMAAAPAFMVVCICYLKKSYNTRQE